ncbi:MAG TPA: PBP1A family penicillin-binding protein [Spirochaetota bacterium]|nr:PBP1A family penicillin-binding protein [Spirochaetota bacterium]
MKKRNIAIYIILCAVLLIPFIYTVYAYTVSYALIKESAKLKQSAPSRIYDRNGELVAELYDEYRDYTAISEIPECLKLAFIAAEDNSFFMHSGIDLPGIIRAVIVDLTSGELRQGGSTITQQLAKQVYTTRERSVKRKLVELFLAREFEKNYTKEQILEMYLNRIYFSHGVYGVGAAAEFYFGKKLKDINTVEACVLACIPSAPDWYSPLKNPASSYEKSRSVLFNLIASGYISKPDAAAMFNSFWEKFTEQSRTRFTESGIRRENTDRAPWFTEYIRRELVAMYGEDMVYRGGLVVRTTVDIAYQDYADTVMDEVLREQNKRSVWQNTGELKKIEREYAKLSVDRNGNNAGAKSELTERTVAWNRAFIESVSDEVSIAALITGNDGIDAKVSGAGRRHEAMMRKSRAEGAIAVIDPANGEILALCGGSKFSQSNQLNRAVQSRRQPGSSFKAFVYGAAIESGKITAATSFYDSPITYKGRRDTWKPSNYDKDFSGRVLARKAFAMSLNIVSARIYDITGGESITGFASKLTGVPVKRFQTDPTLSLGTTELTPLEMAAGFSVFANNGFSVTPHAIREVTDSSGKILYTAEGRYKKVRVMDDRTAFIMTDIMRDVVDSGTATYAVRSEGGFRLPCAGKTGTNTEFRDAWFIGFTPDIVASVWIGCESPEFSLGSGRSGAAIAAPAWGKFMSRVYSSRKRRSFRSAPPGVTARRICSVTGKAADRNCQSRNEYFLAGTEPVEQCDGLHGKLSNISELISREKNSSTSGDTKLFDKTDQSEAGDSEKFIFPE